MTVEKVTKVIKCFMCGDKEELQVPKGTENLDYIWMLVICKKCDRKLEEEEEPMNI